MIEIIKDKVNWDRSVESLTDLDFYHTFDYHQISKMDYEEPLLIKFSNKDITIYLPLLIREIQGTKWKDATSVYGYPGPISKAVPDNFNNAVFQTELQDFFLENDIVSVFSRLNPYIADQDACLQDIGQITQISKVVNIDISQDTKLQWKQYRSRLKSYVNKSRRLCTIKRADSTIEVEKFISMYHDNMRRLDALPYYFFEPTYFFDLLSSTKFETQLLLAMDNDTKKVIAGAIFIVKNKIIQYHLSAAKPDFLHLNGVKLLIDEMRVKGSRAKYQYFNLGGGLGNKEDSLFYFKSNFSNDFRPFKIWKYIVNDQVYDELVKKNNTSNFNGKRQKNSTFFPEYRDTT